MSDDNYQWRATSASIQCLIDHLAAQPSAQPIAGTETAIGTLLRALAALDNGDYLAGLDLLRLSLYRGLDRFYGRLTFGFVVLVLQHRLDNFAGLETDYLKPSTLGLFRVANVELNTPGLPLIGPESQIVFTEKTPLLELQQVFLGLLDPAVTGSPAAMERFVIELQGRVADASTPAKEVARCLALLAAVAVQANDFKSVCEFIARAHRLDPEGEEVLFAGQMAWVCLLAAARDGLLVGEACRPAAADLMEVLWAALANEASYRKRPTGTADHDQQVAEVLP